MNLKSGNFISKKTGWIGSENGHFCRRNKEMVPKGGYFSERVIRFSNLQNENIPKNYPELKI